MDGNWRVYVRDSDRVVIGALDVWDDLTIVTRNNRAGSFTLRVPGENAQASLLAAGNGIVVYSPHVPDVPIFHGPIRTIERASVDGFAAATLTVSGIDDVARLAYRLVWPEPGEAITAQTLATDDRDDEAETVIRGLINDNAGPAALAARRIAGLTMTTDASQGSTVETVARYDNLLELCTALASVGGVTFWVEQDGATLNVKFREPADRSASVRFSAAMGNLTSWKYSITAPTATRAIVAGLGADEDRWMSETAATGPETQWADRVEMFVDARDTDEPDILTQRGNEELVTAGSTAGLSIAPVDIPGMRFGVDYFLGDTVSVELDSESITLPVAEVTIKVGADGATVTPAIGDADVATDSTALYARVRSIAKRVGLVERRK